MVDILNKLLEEYKSVITKEQLEALKAKTVAVTPTESSSPPPVNPFEPVNKFFHAVYDKSMHRNPDRDAFTHLIISVEDSYKEQGGNEAVVQVLKDVEKVTKNGIHKLEEDIAKQGVTEYLKNGLQQVEKKSLEVGGAILDKVGELEQDVQKSGGITEYVKKELVVVEQAVVPVATQATNVIIDGSAQAGGLIMDKFEQIGKDVESKGGLNNYIKAGTEETLAKGMEIGSILAASAAGFGQEAKEKGISAAFFSTMSNLANTFGKKDKSSSESGFDSDSS